MSEHVENQENRLIDIRHDIHRNPEISGAEIRTSKLVVDKLEALGFEIQSGVGGHGVIATLEGSRPGPVVAFRADMDAVRSATEDPVDFRSLTPGVRHICGHDIHTTIGIGLAEGFAAIRDELAGTVMLIFQPAEERGTGAKAMLADGAFTEVLPDAIFSLHTTPYNLGQIATRHGGLMAGRASISVKISGEGDLDGAYSSVQEILRSIDSNSPQDPDVPSPDFFIRVQLFGGQAGSQISGQIMTAGMRDRKLAKSRVEKELDAFDLDGVRLELNYDDGFMEGVTNDSLLVDQSNASIAKLAPNVEIEQAETASPMFSEDFGSFQVLVPGVMYFLGVSNPEKGTVGMPHTPTYVADDGAILVGTRAMLAAMLGRLMQD